jgi:hypothetical protein
MNNGFKGLKMSYNWYFDDFSDEPDMVTRHHEGEAPTQEHFACWITRLGKDLNA